MSKTATNHSRPFLTDVETLRALARKNIAEGPITPNYKGDPKHTVEVLQTVLAT